MSETFDFVVVGSGGGSMCAALLMRSLGKSVVILEKADVVGGTTARSGGVMWIPNNRFMSQAGVEDSQKRADDYLDYVVGDRNDTPGATRVRRRAFVAEAPRMLDFLIDQGVKLRRIPTYPDYYDDAPGASGPGRTVVAELFDINQLGDWRTKLAPGFLPVPANLDEAMLLPAMRYSWKSKGVLLRVMLRGFFAKLGKKQLVTAGAALQGRMLQAALKAGVDIRASTPVEKLVIEQGRVKGVVAQVGGQAVRIDARLGVLLNAGGFARNQQMLDRFVPGVSTSWTNAGLGDTGEMIEEAERIGAVLGQMDVRVSSQVALVPGARARVAGVQSEVAKPHTIIVDQSGERYMSEAGSYMDFCRSMVERNKHNPAVPSWMVLDSQYLRRYMLAGSLPGTKKPQDWFESGFLRQGATLDELAAACSMDAVKLRATVERFNGFARTGRDEDFHRGQRFYERWLGDSHHKPSPTLGSIEVGPFYALQIFPGDVGTFGGVVTDEYARVLREDGSPIEGLYATGASTASAMGRTSPGPGSSIGPTFTWGYVAAKHAANAGNLAPTTAAFATT